eukprot:TRINITY_DN17054_c0_g1_i1.p1 TRINITY_DN17054_c0_g1~~TRINITY_DN17054_c0_g1_i1.p1  ORF type:complete len:1172 (+),score=256.68 TRINITY_DN17054_c0_g1_i1:69-3584(+)
MPRWPVVCLTLAWAVIGQEVRQAKVWEDVDTIEALPPGLASTWNVVILCTGAVGAVAVVAWAGFRVTCSGANGCCTGSVRLPVLLLGAQLLSVLSAGICTWIVTYTASRDALEDQINRMLLFAGESASTEVLKQLTPGVALVDDLYQMFEAGVLDPHEPFPRLHEHMLHAEKTLGRMTESVSAWYMGMENGNVAGIAKSSQPDKLILWTSIPPKHCPDGGLDYGTPASTCRAVLELVCASNRDVTNCQHLACDDGNGGCRFCHTNLGRVEDSEQCPGCKPCAQWVGPVYEQYHIDRMYRSWDLPATTLTLAGFCHKTHPGGNATTIYAPRGTPWYGGFDFIRDGRCGFPYDPRLRPWYRRESGYIWTAPYRYLSGTGFSLTRAVPNRRYTGAPYISGTPANLADTPWAGVLAVDYRFTTLSAYLSGIVPSDRSVAMFVDTSGALLGSSEGLPDTLIRNALNHSFTYYDSVRRIVKKFGNLTEATFRKAILQGRDSVILTYGVRVTQGDFGLVLVIDLPYKDVTREGEQATTEALGIALVICFCGGILVFAMVVIVLRPVHMLKEHMESVSVMDLERVQYMQNKAGIATEIRAMAKSFDLMIDALSYYRSYMPQVVLLKDMKAQKAPASGDFAIVFTDIVGSTKLFEANSEAMCSALELHNSTARLLINEYCGYEVKTIGDSFMVAFADASNAVLFGVVMHERLLEADWPTVDAFEQVSDYWPRQVYDGVVVWNGLAIRIGVGYGSAQHETNPATERSDYRGRMVNLAARLEKLCPRGAVMISEPCYIAVSDDAKLLRDVHFEEPVEVWPSGISEKTRAVVVVSRRLRSRLTYTTWRVKNPLSVDAPLRSSASGDTDGTPTSGGSGKLSPRKSKMSEGRGGSESAALSRIAGLRSSRCRRATIAFVLGMDGSLHGDGGRETEGSVQCIQTSFVQFLSAQSEAQGILMYMAGNTATATFNLFVQGPCAYHEHQGLTFAAKLTKAVPFLCVGVASGKVWSTEVGTTQQTHVMTGLTPSLAQIAAYTAASLDTKVLACYTGRPPADLRDDLDPIDRWGALEAGKLVIVSVERPKQGAFPRSKHCILGLSGQDMAVQELEPSALSLRKSFDDALELGRAGAIQDFVSLAGNDLVLRRVAHHLERHVGDHSSGRKYRIAPPCPVIGTKLVFSGCGAS